MEALKAKLAVWTKDRMLVRVAVIVLGAVLALLACLCISIHMRSNIQEKYSTAVDQMQEDAYQHLISMTELFARVEEPNVDVRNKLIPELRVQYTAASALNDVLSQSCGTKEAVLSTELAAAFDSAFEQYATAYRNGAATGLAQADMAACIEEVQAMITLRYPPEKDANDDVVVIDASSGQIQEE